MGIALAREIEVGHSKIQVFALWVKTISRAMASHCPLSSWAHGLEA
jgi:hypothetical protein